MLQTNDRALATENFDQPYLSESDVAEYIVKILRGELKPKQYNFGWCLPLGSHGVAFSDEPDCDTLELVALAKEALEPLVVDDDDYLEEECPDPAEEAEAPEPVAAAATAEQTHEGKRPATLEPDRDEKECPNPTSPATDTRGVREFITTLAAQAKAALVDIEQPGLLQISRLHPSG
jgi:hypothetical protein